MFLKRAMRYYRVWIYSCNLALFLSTLVFIILSLWIASDFHLSLFPSITFYQPSFIYAYMALTLQSGILQAIGCVGANRMNERLLGLYWQIILVLLIGDIVVGIIWLFRYNLLLTNLRSDLIYRLDNDYGFDTDFQELWDRVQSEHQCCGIDTPYDYNVTQWFEREHVTYEGAPFLVPQSCCAYHRFPAIPTIVDSTSRAVDEGGGGGGAGSGGNSGGVASASVTSDSAVSKEGISSRSTGSNDINGPGDNSGGGGGRGGGGGGYDGDSMISTRTTSPDCMDSYRPENIYTAGCYNQILDWLQSSVDCLSVIGFCVITFLKLCFAFILRYEIKEMIQKINLIKGDKERNDSTALQHLEVYLPRPSIQNDSNQALLSNQAPNSQQSNNNNTNSNINSNNSNTVNNNNNMDNNSNNNNNINANSNANITNKRNRITTANQSFNSSIGSYGTSCGDSTTINIPGRYSPQSIGNLGNTFSSSLTTSPPTNRLIISSATTVTTTITNNTTTSSHSSTTTAPTSTSTSTPVTLITTVTSSSGAETTILPPPSSTTTTSAGSTTLAKPLIGLISIPMGDTKSNTKSKSFKTNGNNNQVLVTNF